MRPDAWRALLRAWAASPPPPPPDRREWTWGHTGRGHEGVHAHEDQLVWYRHDANPHLAVGGPQSLDDFLERGPLVDGLPEAQLRELHAVVSALVRGR